MSDSEDSLVYYPNSDDSDDWDWTHREETSSVSETIIDIRIQQRNGRKSVTTIAGINLKYKLQIILNDMKKQFHCNGILVDKTIIQLQGDHRQRVVKFLLENELCTKDEIKIHGG